jgi:hypothetical protein
MEGDQGYSNSALSVRMAVLIRMAERGVAGDDLENETGIPKSCVLYFNFHTIESLARMSVALGWPNDHIERMLRVRGLEIQAKRNRTS